ncbi:hypothetical protein B0H17DRAFT_1142152 [Mycena rosella]|uniref:Uncharacterized protein n=1 Tax=Mycena rosella TaxID=1033263 RepID=A0AAD7CXZ9_MYCRO|nr:hypothetical protein B0H17DRAFT_1142152 [Mycena rosella]
MHVAHHAPYTYQGSDAHGLASGPQALQAKPAQARPSQADVGPERAQGFGLKIFKPEPGLQARAWNLNLARNLPNRPETVEDVSECPLAYSSPGSGQSQARPSPGGWLGLWPEESQAQARSSQAKALAFRPSQAKGITM